MVPDAERTRFAVKSLGFRQFFFIKDENRLWLLILGSIIMVLVAIVDFVTGPDLYPTIFYLIPVAFFALSLGGNYAMIASAVCALLWFLSDIFTVFRYSHPVVPYWNAFLNMLVFLGVSWIVIRLQAQLRREEETAKALRKINEEVVKLAKVKSDFCTMVSHDLRTPMTVIRESIELVQSGFMGPLNDNQKKYLEVTRRNADKLLLMVSDVLDYTKLERGKRTLEFKKRNLNRLAEESVQFHRPLAEKKGLELSANLDNHLPEVECDEMSISQILSNLIGNAIKFTQVGKVTVVSRLFGAQAEISVADTGCGIASEDMHRLFEPFERIGWKTGKRTEGTGLGLAITKRLVEIHRGKIWAESAEGKGTTFYFRIPLTLPAPEEPV